MAVSFLCSVLESVLMSTSLSYINLREEEGYAPAKLMSAYKEDTGRPLAAIFNPFAQEPTIANPWGDFFAPETLWVWIPVGAVLFAYIASAIARNILKVR